MTTLDDQQVVNMAYAFFDFLAMSPESEDAEGRMYALFSRMPGEIWTALAVGLWYKPGLAAVFGLWQMAWESFWADDERSFKMLERRLSFALSIAESVSHPQMTYTAAQLMERMPSGFSFREGDRETAPQVYLLAMLVTACPFPVPERDLNYILLQDRNQPNLLDFASYLSPDDQRARDAYFQALERGELLDPPRSVRWEEARQLAQSFVPDLLRQAASGRPYVGTFEMKPPPAGDLWREVQCQSIRIAIRPQGIWFALVHEPDHATIGWWTPDQGSSLPMTVGIRHTWMFTLFFAAVWRDACVVKKRAFQEARTQGAGRQRPTSKVRGLGKVVYLPRTQVQWGTPQDRATIEVVQRRYRGRVAHYRRLPEGQRRSPKAEVNAESYGFPPPPPDMTFVRPTPPPDGTELPSVPKVVCRGLNTVAALL